mmetsp:Transcript_21002/g.45430  ORF Transcript_21002/g.45430 Transcript_21002/m.45430 type:complete len:272 (-) Transcript_21002:1085-1900(-)
MDSPFRLTVGNGSDDSVVPLPASDLSSVSPFKLCRKNVARDCLFRDLRAIKMGSSSSSGSLTMPVSMPSMVSRIAEILSFKLRTALMWSPAVSTCRPMSMCTCWRSRAIAGPRSLVQPRKNTSIRTVLSCSSARQSKSMCTSRTGMPNSWRAFLTFGFWTISESSCSSMSPDPSLSASVKIFSREAMVFVSFRMRFLFSFSSLSRALRRVLSTTAPMMVFSKARDAMVMKAMNKTTIPVRASTIGQTRDPDHLSLVKTWNKLYTERVVVPQ